jgi:hypothetical protein
MPHRLRGLHFQSHTSSSTWRISDELAELSRRGAQLIIQRSADDGWPPGLDTRLAGTGGPLVVPRCMRERVCAALPWNARSPPEEDNGERRHGLPWP